MTAVERAYVYSRDGGWINAAIEALDSIDCEDAIDVSEPDELALLLSGAHSTAAITGRVLLLLSWSAILDELDEALDTFREHLVGPGVLTIVTLDAEHILEKDDILAQLGIDRFVVETDEIWELVPQLLERMAAEPPTALQPLQRPAETGAQRAEDPGVTPSTDDDVAHEASIADEPVEPPEPVSPRQQRPPLVTGSVVNELPEGVTLVSPQRPSRPHPESNAEGLPDGVALVSPGTTSAPAPANEPHTLPDGVTLVSAPRLGTPQPLDARPNNRSADNPANPSSLGQRRKLEGDGRGFAKPSDASDAAALARGSVVTPPSKSSRGFAKRVSATDLENLAQPAASHQFVGQPTRPVGQSGGFARVSRPEPTAAPQPGTVKQPYQQPQGYDPPSYVQTPASYVPGAESASTLEPVTDLSESAPLDALPMLGAGDEPDGDDLAAAIYAESSAADSHIDEELEDEADGDELAAAIMAESSASNIRAQPQAKASADQGSIRPLRKRKKRRSDVPSYDAPSHARSYDAPSRAPSYDAPSRHEDDSQPRRSDVIPVIRETNVRKAVHRGQSNVPDSGQVMSRSTDTARPKPPDSRSVRSRRGKAPPPPRSRPVKSRRGKAPPGPSSRPVRRRGSSPPPPESGSTMRARGKRRFDSSPATLSPGALYRRALQLLESANYEEAVEYLDKALVAEPTNIEYLLHRTWALYLDKRMGARSVRTELEQIVDKHTKAQSQAWAWTILGRLERAEGNEDASVKAYRRVLDFDPEHAEAIRVFRLLQMRDKDKDTKGSKFFKKLFGK